MGVNFVIRQKTLFHEFLPPGENQALGGCGNDNKKLFCERMEGKCKRGIPVKILYAVIEKNLTEYYVGCKVVAKGIW